MFQDIQTVLYSKPIVVATHIHKPSTLYYECDEREGEREREREREKENTILTHSKENF